MPCDPWTTWLALELTRQYHAIVPSLKALRAHQQWRRQPWWRRILGWRRHGPSCSPRALEWHRHQATGIFNRVAILYLQGWLSSDLLRLTISPAGARLWLAYVAPLDLALRQRQHGERPSAPPHPIVRFWTEVADGRLPPADGRGVDMNG